MMIDNTHIALTTTGGSRILDVGHQGMVISASDLAGAEVVDVEIQQGTTFGPSGVQLTATDFVTKLQGPCKYNLLLSSSIALVAVYANG